MLEGPILTAYKRDYMVAIKSQEWVTRMTKNSPQAHQNKHKSFTKLSQKHARNKAQSIKHVKANHGITRQVCKASMVCLNQVKAVLYHGKISTNNT